MRKSIRDFTGEVVPADLVQSLVVAANRNAPSSKNTQPWKLILAQGQALENLRTDYTAAFNSGKAPDF